MIWQCGQQKYFDLSKQGIVMGILNVTPDSFSDGGNFDGVGAARDHAMQMFAEGAAVVDVGGESTRPGAEPVDTATEMARVLPVIDAILQKNPQAVLSVDTSKAEVAAAACEAGAVIINDVTGLTGDVQMANVVAATGAGLVLMHSRGTPLTMQDHTTYDDVVAEVVGFFQQQVELAISAGVDKSAIVLDPGIGFGKNDEHHAKLLRQIPHLLIDKHPLLIGLSRKSFIGRILQRDSPQQRDAATLTLTALTRSAGAKIHRVHEVRPNLDALRMTEWLMGDER
ncbi:MAG: dihydropteroate synthase [Verrucomicrobiales bacterium]|nr:dihydropteroate synthase [Verrucomicrobiales bacterium]